MKMIASYRGIVHNPQFAWKFVGIQIAIFAAVTPASCFFIGTVEIVVVPLDHAPAILRVLWVDFIKTK